MASSSSTSSEELRNWETLPCDLTANILQRLGAIDILKNAQKVCNNWYKICKDPAIWRLIDIKFDPNLMNWIDPKKRRKLKMMCMNAVDRSQGQLVDISIQFFGTEKLLRSIGERSSQLTRLQLVSCKAGFGLKTTRLPLLEELHLYNTCISVTTIETIGQSCPRLKSFKCYGDSYEYYLGRIDVIAITENMPGLRHLRIFGYMSNDIMQSILDKLAHLESLDLSQCKCNLNENIMTRCFSQIKDFKCPQDGDKFDETYVGGYLGSSSSDEDMY